MINNFRRCFFYCSLLCFYWVIIFTFFTSRLFFLILFLLWFVCLCVSCLIVLVLFYSCFLDSLVYGFFHFAYWWKEFVSSLVHLYYYLEIAFLPSHPI